MKETKKHSSFAMMSKPEQILFWSNNLWMLGVGMFGPLFAVFVQQIGGDIFDISWAYATYLVVTGVAIIFVGRLADKIGHERLLVSGYALNAAATFGYIFVSSTLGLFVVQIFLGVALALTNPTWLALYDRFSGDGRIDGYIWALRSGGGYVMSGIALVLGGFIVNAFSFDVLFFIMGVILTLSTVCQAWILKFERK